MRGILYVFIALTGTIAVIVFMTKDTLSYKTYKEDGREIARLLEVAEEDDGTKTARILDFSRVLYAEEQFPHSAENSQLLPAGCRQHRTISQKQIQEKIYCNESGLQIQACKDNPAKGLV